MVKKFKVSFEAETDDRGFTHAPHETTRQYAEGADGFLIGVPIDAEITEIKPQFEAGWYQDIDLEDVSFWSADQIQDWDVDAPDRPFDQTFRRMNPPTPYEEGPELVVGRSYVWDEIKDLPKGSTLQDKDGDHWYRDKDTGKWLADGYGTIRDYHNYEPYELISVGAK